MHYQTHASFALWILQLSPGFQPSSVCQPRLLKCDDCNLGFDTVKEFHSHNKNNHAKPKTRKSTPTRGCGCGAGSLPKSPKPPPVGRSVTIHSGNENNTQSVPTPSGNENRVVSSNPLGKGVGVGLPLKNMPMQHINDSCPKPISDKQVKKEIENGSGIQQSDFSVVWMLDVVLVCPVCKEYLVNQNWLENIKNTSTKLKTVKMEMLLLNKKIRQMFRNN